MAINIHEDNLKHGVLGLVVALVEIIKDALKHQAVRRMEGGSLTDAEIERLGKAIKELDCAIEELKREQGVSEAVRSVRDGLDDLATEVVHQFINPARQMHERKH